MDLFRRIGSNQNVSTVSLRAEAEYSNLLWLLSGITILCAVSLLVAAPFLTIDQAVPAKGRLIPLGGFAYVTSPVDGVVDGALAKAGQPIRAGQPIFRISTSVATDSARTGIGSQLDRELKAQLHLAEADIAAGTEECRTERDGLMQKIRNASGQKSALARKISLLQVASSSKHALVERIRPLTKDRIISEVQLDSYQDAATSIDMSLIAAQMELQTLDGQRQDLRSSLKLSALQCGAKLRGSRQKASALSASSVQNESAKSILVTSEMPGVLDGVVFAEGQSVSKGDRLATVLPSHPRLRAEVWVPSGIRGDIKLGAPVKIVYDALSTRRVGPQAGTVVSVSRSVFMPAQIERLGGVTIPVPAYRVLVELTGGSGALSRANIPLVPDMPLTASLIVGKQRLSDLVFGE